MNEQLKEAIGAIGEDFEARLENIKAIKGEKFANCVVASINGFSLWRLLTLVTADQPKEARDMISNTVRHMTGTMTKLVFENADLTPEQIVEVVELSKNISAGVHQQTEVLRQRGVL